ncbi:AraC family transcriptional regulator [Leptospira yasudae]|uniref:AraC family transcriptional regulator n=1 Tax=Leptospira yasudae TaxID=2202201 RepID=UPI002990135E|nr:GyrI-like domain-containing protein [Leptospira yasudae]
MKRREPKKLYPAWDHIQQKIGEPIGLNQLAFLSNLSPWHFHRIFSKLQGESVQEYIRRLRLEKAAYELKISSYPILEIALEAGYESNEAFTKAFKRAFQITPKEFRNRFHKEKRTVWKESAVPNGIDPDEIYKKEISSFPIVYVRHHGPYEEFPGFDPNSEEVQSLLSFLKSKNSLPENHQWIGISQDDPEITPSEKIRFDLGVSVAAGEVSNEGALGKQTVAGGKYLVVRHRGDYSKLPEVYSFLLNRFATEKKLALKNSPPFEVYLDPFRKKFEVTITDIYIPLQK